MTHGIGQGSSEYLQNPCSGQLAPGTKEPHKNKKEPMRQRNPPSTLRGRAKQDWNVQSAQKRLPSLEADAKNTWSCVVQPNHLRMSQSVFGFAQSGDHLR